ncbi:MAG TPA: S41 family peptidase [Terriglobales bacterium]|jgi:carboxyl-terminal processing protease|nr:S41 family peptidase [Terriglobales bacterium]
MPKSIKAALLGLSALVVVFVVAGGLGVRAENSDGAYRQLGVYSEVLSRVRTEYVEEPNIPHVTDGALHGLLEALDADSSYLNPAEYKQYKEHKSEGKASIGAAISKRFGYGAVIAVLPNGPAAKAGIETGDIIEAVDTHSTREMSLAELHSVLSGQQGSNVSLSVVRARRSEPLKIVVTRDMVAMPAASDKMLEEGIGYIKSETLNKGKAAEIAAEVKRLQHSGAKKLILDLRDDAEGDEQEGVAVANLFLNHGTIAYVQGQKYPRETYSADAAKAITTLPLVVLVNRGTAGPAEIVAGAILENARGDVVGDKTFGVGSIQKVIEIPDGSALILSVAKYYTPSGKAIQDSAITPNILVADKEDDATLPDDEDNTAPAPTTPKPPQQDEQLRRAVQVLKQQKA